MRRAVSISSSTSSMLAHGYFEKEDDDYAETLTDAPTTSLTKGRVEGSLLQTSHGLRFLSIVLHSVLVAIHLALLAIWSKEAEHRVIFSLDRQKTVSFTITAITTGFGTIYLGLIVFVTQTISVRRLLQADQTLTAIHDSTAAWAGIGSAVFHLWHQTRVRGSLMGVLSIFLSLGSVLILHVSTPALFAVQTFDSPRLSYVSTTSLPGYNDAQWMYGKIQPADRGGVDGSAIDGKTFPGDYAAGSLVSLPPIANGSRKSLGLSGSTYFDVLDANVGVGNGTVSATGFNISCKYPPSANITYNSATGYFVAWAEGLSQPLAWKSTQRKVISALLPGGYDDDVTPVRGNLTLQTNQPGLPGPLFMYSTIPIVDSTNQHPPMLNLTPFYSPINASDKPAGETVPAVQILRCSQTLVPQKAVVDAQSNDFFSVDPDIQKSTSSWQPYTNLDIELDNTTSGNKFLDSWAQWYLLMPPSRFPFSPAILSEDSSLGQYMPYVSVGAMYLIQKLRMHVGQDVPPFTDLDRPLNVTLHDLENALGVLVASMFWTMAHFSPTLDGLGSSTEQTFIVDATVPPPVTMRGNGTVTEIVTQGRLDLNIIAIAGGLVASIVLTLLAIPSLLPLRGAKEQNIPIDGTGFLHAIWLYRNNPELETLLPQAEHPTATNLREAGMVRARLI
ncbi:hypothetical protein DFH06DRAFT_1190436 [Mycena polygramma]|nr:hypothetical protein DFH06DRAFT_1190436 [Mycena polygramma]